MGRILDQLVQLLVIMSIYIYILHTLGSQTEAGGIPI